MKILSEQYIITIQKTAEQLTASNKRAFQVQITIDYLESQPHLAEKIFGWEQEAVALGLQELQTGIIQPDNFKLCRCKNQKIKITHWKPIFAI